MAAKICPRCGAQYASLKSATCPQCFAKLVVVDDSMAEELAAARVAVENTPEFQAAKVADDERFNEQSFGACLGVAAIAVLTLVIAAVLIVAAVRQNHRVAMRRPGLQTARSVAAHPDPLTPLPAPGAPLEQVMPEQVGSFRLQNRDQQVTLPGTLTPVFHGVYRLTGLGASPVQVYAIPIARPTSEQNEFRLGLGLATQMQAKAASAPLIFATEHWRYGAFGSGAMASPEEFRAALAAQFVQK